MPNANSLNGFEDLDTKSSPLSASACDGIWLLDDDVSMLKALGRLMNSAGFIVEKFNLPAETRIIFISGRDDPSVRQTALDAGAFAFLAKPFEDEVLVELIQKAVAD